MNMCLHIDGSAIRHPRKQSCAKKWTIGWAMVVNHGQTERHGATTVNQDIHGEHEMVAFIEGVIYAKSCGIAPQNLVVYTDDAMIGYAPMYMWKPNYMEGYRDKIIASCRRVLKAAYSEELLPTIVEYLENARIHKLKGHVGFVYQERADYLARTSAYLFMGETPKDGMMDYDSWLDRGFVRYRSNSEVEVRYPAFVGH